MLARPVGWVPSRGNSGQSLAGNGWGDAWKMAPISGYHDGGMSFVQRGNKGWDGLLCVLATMAVGPAWAGLGKPIPGVPGTLNRSGSKDQMFREPVWLGYLESFGYSRLAVHRLGWVAGFDRTGLWPDVCWEWPE